MKRIAIAFILALVLFGCLGLFGGSNGEKNIIPNKATGYAVLKYQELLSTVTSASSTATETAQIENYTNELQDKYGIDSSKISKVIIFFDYSGALPLDAGGLSLGSAVQAKPYVGAIMRGQFDSGAITQKLLANGWAKSSYNGADYYTKDNTNTTKGSQPQSLGAVALVDGAVVAGTEESVKDVIDVDSGKLPALSDEGLTEAGSKVNGDALFFMVMKVPKSQTPSVAVNPAEVPAGAGGFLGSSRSPGSGADLYSGATDMALSADKQGDNVEMKLAVLFDSAGNASKAGSSLDGMVKMMRGLTKSGSAAEAVVQGLSVSTSDKFVLVELKTTGNDLTKLGDELMKPAAYNPTAYPSGPQNGTYNSNGGAGYPGQGNRTQPGGNAFSGSASGTPPARAVPSASGNTSSNLTWVKITQNPCASVYQGSGTITLSAVSGCLHTGAGVYSAQSFKKSGRYNISFSYQMRDYTGVSSGLNGVFLESETAVSEDRERQYYSSITGDAIFVTLGDSCPVHPYAQSPTNVGAGVFYQPKLGSGNQTSWHCSWQEGIGPITDLAYDTGVWYDVSIVVDWGNQTIDVYRNGVEISGGPTAFSPITGDNFKVELHMSHYPYGGQERTDIYKDVRIEKA